ncbi:splicing factor 3B subunit [Trifolium repens]|nr:splicing factor 3B subunit [Trifolium repens]
MNQISTSFFITNFPMELGWGDIWKIFVKFGSVSDVYIPKKVDKWGRKFGFVKFKDVRDADEMFKKLQEVWYGTTKLSVKRARFGKEDQKEEDSGTKTGKGTRCADVEDEGGVRRKSRLHSVEDLAPLQIEVCESTLKELEGSKVGFLKNSMDFSSFQERLMLDGHHEVKVIQMGGNMVLFQSPCEGELEEVMKCTTISNHHFYVARVKLRTVRRVLIDTDVQLSVMGSTFDVWVVEERCCCGLEGRVEEEGSDDNSGRASMNSGVEVWPGQKEDLFSDVVQEGYGEDAFSSQPFVEVMVGEKVLEGHVMVGQVEGLGESSMMIPREEGIEVLGCSVNGGMLERSTAGLEGDVLGFEEREVVVGSLN